MKCQDFRPLADLGDLLFIKGHPYMARLKYGQDFFGDTAYHHTPRHRVRIYGERGMVETSRLEPDDLLFLLTHLGIQQEKAEMLAYEYRKDWTMLLAKTPEAAPPTMKQLLLFEV